MERSDLGTEEDWTIRQRYASGKVEGKVWD
jgi:hypothetical protein